MPSPREIHSRTLTGIAAAPGLASGPAVVWRERDVTVPRTTGGQPDAETARLAAARAAARDDIRRLRTKVAAEAGEAEAAIFDAHLMFIDDGALLVKAQAAIAGGVNAEAAWADAIEFFAAQLQQLPDPTLRSRAGDVRDVGGSVLTHLLGHPAAGPDLRVPAVVVARDLAPSQIASLPMSQVLAFCTAEGGPTSHTAILAKAWSKPAVVGLGAAALEIRDGARLLVDGARGEVVVDPDQKAARAFSQRQAEAEQRAATVRRAAHEPAITRDGHRIEVGANVGAVEEASAALEAGADGIGLLRTEFLYLSRRSAPTEDDNFAAYRAILQTMGPRPVVARTIDIGGDKPLPYLDLPKEANPFLGWRAIRVSLQRPELFTIQLRALLRSSPGHDLRIMFPMIATPVEFRAASAALEEARQVVIAAGHSVAPHIRVGMMVEVPSAVVLADQFAREADFFSIGTNDLTQYTLAADRTNERVAYLSDACHPAVLRQIKTIVDTAHRARRWVGVCGELAGDLEAVPLLVGLGLDELSMVPPAIPAVKALIRQWSRTRAQQLATQALDLDSASAVRDLVRATPPT